MPEADALSFAGLSIPEAFSTTPGITITRSASGTTVSESGGLDKYTIALDSLPAGSVTITIDANADIEISLDGNNFAASQTIVATNTSPQTIAVRAIDDAVIEGTETSLLSHKIVASTSATYPVTLELDSISVDVADNDALLPLLGIDFDSNSSTTARPTNWNNIDNWIFGGSRTFSNLILEDGNLSPVDLTITRGFDSVGNGGSSPQAATLPIHTTSLALVDSVLTHNSTSTLEIDWENLNPNTIYDVWVFGLESFGGFNIDQLVTITGSGIDDPAPFVQNSAGKNGVLIVNGQDGNSNSSLESYAVPVTSNSNGEIHIDFNVLAGSNAVVLAGVGIQQASPVASGVSVTESTNTVLAEGGTTDTYTINLDTIPSGPVEITVSADAQSEVSLDGINFASSQTFTRTDMTTQTVTVRAIDDSAIESTHISRITHWITGTVNDPNYPASTFIAPVTATITDNDFANPPTVESVVINNNDSQRSSLTTIEVTFDSVVDIDQVSGDAFQFVNLGTTNPVTDIPIIDNTGPKTVVRFTFDTLDASVTNFGSLIDGDYQLTIPASLVSARGITMSQDFVFGAVPTDSFFRRYGDSDGSGFVDLSDFSAFRQAFGTSTGDQGYRPELDSNSDGTIGLVDFAAFRQAFGN